MTSSSGQGAAPSGGCPRGTPASENRDGTRAAVTGSGAGSHAVPSVCGRQREEDRARGRQIRGASGGEGAGSALPELRGCPHGEKTAVRLRFTLFSPQCLNFLIFPPDAAFPRTSASSVGAESGIIPK